MSTIELEKMIWGNMFSYAEDNEISLNDNRLTQIIGVNGAGKSSIPTILEEALYNKNSKGFKKAEIPNRHIGSPYFVEIPFKYDGDSYHLSVKKASTLKVSLSKSGEDISAHTATGTFAILEGILGMSFKTFSQLVYQNTDSSLQFLKATDSKRKEFLVELFDLAAYTEKQVLFTDALKSLNTECSFLEGKINTLETQLEQAIRDSENEELGDPIEVPEFPEYLLEEKATLTSDLKSIDYYNREAKAKNAAFLAAKDLDETGLEAELDNLGPVPDKTQLMEQLGRRNAEIKQSKEVIKKIEGLSGQCPTCLQEVDEAFTSRLVSQNNQAIESHREKAQEIVDEIESIKSLETKRAKLDSEINRIKLLNSKVTIGELLEERTSEGLNNRILEIESSISTIRRDIEKATKYNNELNRHSTRRDMALESLQTLGSELEELEINYSSIQKHRASLEVLKKAFSSTGLVAYKLENKVKDLEDATNNYLASLSDGKFNLAFQLSNDKLNVVIYDEGKEVTMTCLSSGESARVVIATLLGIRKIMQSIAKRTVNVLFLDEVISVLDDLGKEQLVELLLKERGLNTFLVSHGWQHPLVPRLEVVKEDGISTIYD